MRRLLNPIAALVFLAAGVAPGVDARATGRSLRIRAVGDVAVVGTMRDEVLAHGLDPFAGMRSAIAEADLSFANLEAVLTRREPLDGVVSRPGVPLLRSPAVTASLLRATGFDVVSLANNHTFDFGPLGVADTLTHVRAAGLEPVGAGLTPDEARRPFVTTVHGVRIGMLAFTEKTNEQLAGDAYVARLAHAVSRITELRPEVDVLLVSVHWGVQYAARPEGWQRRLARAMVDAGADAVLGHHPHVLQTVELHAGKPIVYSLGNFTFGPQPTPRDASAIAELEVVEGRLATLRLLPVALHGFAGSPVLARGNAAELARSRLRGSLAWASREPSLELALGDTLAAR